jgi:transcriptional regulator with XRE-family HTH domain
MDIGEKIMGFRKRHLLTTRQAGEIFGVSQSEISRLERSKNAPYIITVAKWEKKLEEAEKKMT